MKKSPTKKLWDKLTKGNPILSNFVDPDDILKDYPTGKKIADFISDVALEDAKKKLGKIMVKLVQKEHGK